jgi:hypothetical protein
MRESLSAGLDSTVRRDILIASDDVANFWSVAVKVIVNSINTRTKTSQSRILIVLDACLQWMPLMHCRIALNYQLIQGLFTMFLYFRNRNLQT